MADEYTPTTGNIRSVYAYGGAGQSEDRRRAQFDRWLAAHDRAVKAEALREVARGYWGLDGDPDYPTTSGIARRVLNRRADQIEGATE